MSQTQFRGAMTALITPFSGGDVDVDSLRELVERQIAGGIHGLVPCGTTGESATMSPEEMALVIKTVVEQCKGRVPVVAGVGTNNTKKSCELAQAAKRLGADGTLIVVPYYNKPSQVGLEAHFRAVIEAGELPAIVYDIPGRSVISLELSTLSRLTDLPNLVAIKDASGNVTRAQDQQVLLGDRVTILCGDDGLTLPMMAAGADGVISVTSNAFPKEVSEVVELMWAGKMQEARHAHLRLLPTHGAMFVEPNPCPVKALLNHAGHIEPEVRLPLSWAEEATLENLLAVTGAAGLEA